MDERLKEFFKRADEGDGQFAIAATTRALDRDDGPPPIARTQREALAMETLTTVMYTPPPPPSMLDPERQPEYERRLREGLHKLLLDAGQDTPDGPAVIRVATAMAEFVRIMAFAIHNSEAVRIPSQRRKLCDDFARSLNRTIGNMQAAAALGQLPEFLAIDDTAIEWPPVIDNDDPFPPLAKVVATCRQPMPSARTSAALASVPEPHVRTHRLGEPFTDALTLPCIMMVRGYDGYGPTIQVIEIKLGRTITLNTFPASMNERAGRAARERAITRDAMLIEGLHGNEMQKIIEDVIVAVVSAIRPAGQA